MLKAERAAPQPMHITRKQHREMVRDARFRQYRQGHVTVPDAATGHDADRVRAACNKRVRRNTKRVRDAFRSEIGQRCARECLDGISFSSAGIVDAVLVGPCDTTDQQFADWAIHGWRLGNEVAA
jgi:hypothetical protein